MNRDPIAGFRLGVLLAERFEGGRVFAARLGDTPMERLRQQLLTAGLTLAGAAVSDAGAVPLSTLRFLIRENGASGGAAADGENWIACGAGGRPIPAAELETLARVGVARFRGGEPAEPRAESRGFALHLRRIVAAVDAEAIRLRRLRVAWCADGAAALRMPGFLRKFEVEPVAAPDLAAMPETIARSRCDFGVVPDREGAAVRLFDDRGRSIPPAQSLAMMLEHILEAFPETLAVTSSTGPFAERLAAESGCELRRGGEGEAGLLAAMQSAGSGLGGDGLSGMLVWRRVQPAPDAFAAIAILLELSALSGAALSVIADQTGAEQP